MMSIHQAVVSMCIQLPYNPGNDPRLGYRQNSKVIAWTHSAQLHLTYIRNNSFYAYYHVFEAFLQCYSPSFFARFWPRHLEKVLPAHCIYSITTSIEGYLRSVTLTAWKTRISFNDQSTLCIANKQSIIHV